MVEHLVIYSPGLNDNKFPNKQLALILPRIWVNYGTEGYIFSPNWGDKEGFESRLERLIELIDKLYNTRHKLSLVGQSAGGSLVLNAFCERKEKIHRVIDITGRTRAGENVFPSLELAARGNPAFEQSVRTFEKINEPRLTTSDRRKIMTIRPMWDEIVPASTVAIEGATNKVVPFVEHSLSGALLVSVFWNFVAGFLNDRQDLS